MSSAMIPTWFMNPPRLLRVVESDGRLDGEATASSGEQKNSTKTPSATNPSISFSEGKEQPITDVHTGDTLESDKGGEIESLKECR